MSRDGAHAPAAFALAHPAGAVPSAFVTLEKPMAVE